MFFNSNEFLAFFGAFLLLYWLVRSHLTARNLLILGASYLFYGWWSWAFLLLLIASSLFDFGVGRALGRCQDPGRRKLLLAGSIVVNLGFLGFFKYYNFFVESFVALADRVGLGLHPTLLAVVLPVGISFYTFQSMSYAIDVYRRELEPTRNVIHFLAYVAFFPQLVAGPIGRAARLLPQFESTRTITRESVEEGVWLILWGLFKKVVIADRLAPLVDIVFGSGTYTAPAVLLGTFAFGLQIYGDFSGYSDIARGLAKLLGFELSVNFDRPYFSCSPREFWRRWHISLSTWLRDYLYVPLGGNRRGTARTYLNLFLTMLLGGLWHGAAWHFVFWGAWHGVGLAVHRAWSGKPSDDPAQPRWNLLGWLATFAFVFYGWMLFRAGTAQEVVSMTAALTRWSSPVWLGAYLANLTFCAAPLLLFELWQARQGGVELRTLFPRKIVRATVQSVLLLGVILFWQNKGTQFIYFQF